jgi:chromate reductase, NAD(P)H dehydrogenase (quinone)
MRNNKIINIVAISGSLKLTSSNTNILKRLAEIAPQNVEIKILKGIDELPHFNPEIPDEIPSVINFRQQLMKADGVIISTPEYAFGVPGVLKNALDWVVSSSELYRKPLIAISASPGNSGGDKALASLKLTLTALGSDIDNDSTLSIAGIYDKISSIGEIVDNDTNQSLELILDGLIKKIRLK